MELVDISESSALGVSQVRASYELTFVAASIDLCVRIWFELEKLSNLCAPNQIAASTLLIHAETLRLELLLLLDASDSIRWRCLFPCDQRENLRRLFSNVLDAIAETPDALSCSGIHQAQDLLLDKILAGCANASLRDQRSLACDSSHYGNTVAIVSR